MKTKKITTKSFQTLMEKRLSKTEIAEIERQVAKEFLLMNYRKKSLLFTLILPLILILASCGEKESQQTGTEHSSAAPTTYATEADAVVASYSGGGEEERLYKKPLGIIERLRTKSILQRYLPKPPAVMYDIGGGAGVYAFPLTQKGYSVHLIDITPLHIEQARAHEKESGIKLAENSVGDARAIKAPDAVADAVLFFGPLYHLQDQSDREKSLREAYRILKPGGKLFAVALSRSATAYHFGNKNKLKDPYYAELIERALKTGRYNNTRVQFFTIGYMHTPDEFEKEIKSTGFKDVRLLGIEASTNLFSSLQEIVDDPQALESLLRFMQMMEDDQSILGMSGHMMAIAKK